MLGRSIDSLRGARVALAVLIVAVGAVHVAWVRQETDLLPHADAYAYLARLLRWIDTLRSEGISAASLAVPELSLHGRPPLYQILTAPFVLVFGRSEDAALLVNLLFWALLLVATFELGRACAHARVGLLAACLVACYPPVVNLSRIYRPHFALPACVALSLWLLLRLLETRSVAASWAFVGSLAFGMLIHPSFAWIAAAPTLVFGVSVCLFQVDPKLPGRGETLSWLRGKLGQPLVTRGLLPAGLAAGALVSLWYLTVGAQLFPIFEAYWSGTGPLLRDGDFAVDGFPEVTSRFGWYLLTATGALSWPLALLAAAGLLAAAWRRDRACLVLVVAATGGYVLSNLQPARAWWLFASALPVAAVLSALCVAAIRPGWLSRTLALVCLLVGGFCFAWVTWGAPAWSRPVAVALGAPLESETCRARRNAVFCPNPARTVDRPAGALLRVVRDDPACRTAPCRLVVPQQSYALSRVVLEYQVLEQWPDSSLVIDPAGWRYRGAVPVQALEPADYILYIDSPLDPGPVPAWLRTLRSPRLAAAGGYREAAASPLGSGATMRLVEHRR